MLLFDVLVMRGPAHTMLISLSTSPSHNLQNSSAPGIQSVCPSLASGTKL